MHWTTSHGPSTSGPEKSKSFTSCGILRLEVLNPSGLNPSSVGIIVWVKPTRAKTHLPKIGSMHAPSLALVERGSVPPASAPLVVAECCSTRGSCVSEFAESKVQHVVHMEVHRGQVTWCLILPRLSLHVMHPAVLPT
jgi:hypothetical protein